MTDISNDVIATITDLKDIVLAMKNDLDKIKLEQDKQTKRETIDKCINFGLPFKLDAYVPQDTVPDVQFNELGCSSKGKEKLHE